jgi:hypothetical protein
LGASSSSSESATTNGLVAEGGSISVGIQTTHSRERGVWQTHLRQHGSLRRENVAAAARASLRILRSPKQPHATVRRQEEKRRESG